MMLLTLCKKTIFRGALLLFGRNTKYEILLKTEDGKSAEKFLNQNLSNENFRNMAIHKAIDSKDFDKAISLAKEGIKQDEKKKPCLLKVWTEQLLSIAHLQNDTKKEIEYAQWLFINDIHTELDFYQHLKNIIEPNKWEKFVENLIKDMQAKKHYDYTRVAKIYIRENKIDKLKELIFNNLNIRKAWFNNSSVNLQTMEFYEKYLAVDYRNEVTDWYIAEIKEYMKSQMGKNHYQSACRYLRRVIKLGEREKVNKTIAFLRETYPSRKALIEELAKIKKNRTFANNNFNV